MRAPQSPQKQGSQDGACGFYAIGNAVSLLCPELGVDRVFHAVFRAYLREVAADHFVEGMGRTLLSQLLGATVAALERGDAIEVARPFWTVRPANLAGYKQVLRAHFGRPGPTVAILGYEFCRRLDGPQYSHWTVIRGLTSRSWRTFDSAHERQLVPFSLCRISGVFSRHRTRPYLLKPHETFLLSRPGGGAS